MIYIDFSIQNPFSDKFKNLFCKSGMISKHKAWEVEALRTNTLVEFEFRFNIRGDHAGTRLGIGLFGYSISAQYYDTRHWDYENNTWEVYK